MLPSGLRWHNRGINLACNTLPYKIAALRDAHRLAIDRRKSGRPPPRPSPVCRANPILSISDLLDRDFLCPGLAFPAHWYGGKRSHGARKVNTHEHDFSPGWRHSTKSIPRLRACAISPGVVRRHHRRPCSAPTHRLGCNNPEIRQNCNECAPRLGPKRAESVKSGTLSKSRCSAAF
jgi:hypothetical protein